MGCGASDNSQIVIANPNAKPTGIGGVPVAVNPAPASFLPMAAAPANPTNPLFDIIGGMLGPGKFKEGEPLEAIPILQAQIEKDPVTDYNI